MYDEITEIDKKIQKEKKRYKQALKITQEKESFDQEVDELQILVQTETVRISEKRKLLKPNLTERATKIELEDMLKSFDKQMEKDKEHLQEASQRVEKIKANIKKMQGKKFNITEEKGLLLGEKKIYDQCLMKRVHLMEDLANKYGLELSFSQTQETQSTVMTGYMGTQQSHLSVGNDSISDQTITTDSSSIHLTEEDLRAFRDSIEVKRAELEKQLENHKKRCQDEEDLIQLELGALTAKRLSMENGKRRHIG